jgi:predicted NUDIX family NTP pyrophosphohydrolase
MLTIYTEYNKNMPKLSAGLLLFRRTSGSPEVLLVHPGGPYWAKKDAGTWSVPKGLANEGETLKRAAKREFSEETGNSAPEGDGFELGYVSYGNKKVYVWALEADLDVANIKSSLTSLEWPPRSGQTIDVPECDKADWFNLPTATTKLVKGQVPFIARLAAHLKVGL